MTSPGRYLEKALRDLGVPIQVVTKKLDGNKIDANTTKGILFVETTKAPAAIHMHKSGVPRLFWIHHGKHRLQKNLKLFKKYQPHRVLMSHSLDLKKHFPVPVIFFPFGVAEGTFNNQRTFKLRKYGVAFVGSFSGGFYNQRNRNIGLIRAYLKKRGIPFKFVQNVNPDKMAQIYGKSKIVFNQSSEKVPQTINMRIFEGAGCGALVLTNSAPLQNLLFKDRIHYVVYQNSRDMMNKLRYFLSRPELAERIAKQGYREAKNRHTYSYRAKKIVMLLEQLQHH